MSPTFDAIADINCKNERRIWRFCVRIIRLWRVPNFKQPDQPDFIDMLLMDEKLDKVQCTVWSNAVERFENMLQEGRCYELANLTVALNTYKFRPTTHEYRLYFKMMTTVKPVDDAIIPFFGFHFTPYSDIFQASREDLHLVDVIGVLAAKGDLLEFKRDDKSTAYMVVELDNLEGGEKLRCTLWGEYASQLLEFLSENTTGPVVLIMQLAKMKLFKGTMGISNTTYNSKLLIDIDIPEVEQLKSRYLSINSKSDSQALPQLAIESAYSLKNDFLNVSTYKNIDELKGCRESASFVTFGVVKDIHSISRWSYRGCPTQNCLAGIREQDGGYYCRKCDKNYGTFVLRYNIQLRVADGTDSTTFTLFDREAKNFLKKSAANLLESYVARGDADELYPQEFDAFKDKQFLFKVQVKIQFWNYVEQTNIQVSRLCFDETLIMEFVRKYKLEEGPQQTEFSELGVDNVSSVTIEPIPHDQSVVDSSRIGAPSTSGEKDVVYGKAVGDVGHDGQMSSNKLRKVIKEEQ